MRRGSRWLDWRIPAALAGAAIVLAGSLTADQLWSHHTTTVIRRSTPHATAAPQHHRHTAPHMAPSPATTVVVIPAPVASSATERTPDRRHQSSSRTPAPPSPKTSPSPSPSCQVVVICRLAQQASPGPLIH